MAPRACFAQQCLGFFEALLENKAPRVVAGCYDGLFMFLAMEPHAFGVYVSLHLQCLFPPSQQSIRVRKIALRARECLCLIRQGAAA